MKLKQSFDRAAAALYPLSCKRLLPICLTLFVALGGLGLQRAVAQTAATVNGVTQIPATPAAGYFPINITVDNATYHIKGNFTGALEGPASDPNPPQRRRYPTNKDEYDGTAKTALCSGMVKVEAGKHGIYVARGLKNVKIILEDVGLYVASAPGTGGTATAATPAGSDQYAAFLIDGITLSGAIAQGMSGAGTLAATCNDLIFQGCPEGSNVIVEIRGNNYLWSGTGRASRAGLEVWKGSTVYLEGDGVLVARSGYSRGGQGVNTSVAKGGPYAISGNAADYNELNSPNFDGGAAGIGAGNIAGSGGNVVIRGNPTIHAIAGPHGAGVGGGWANSTVKSYYADILIYGGTVYSWGGGHGAGIGGGCANGGSNSSPSGRMGSVVAMPTATVKAASIVQTLDDLGQMSNVLFFGNSTHPRIAIYTEDYRETEMFIDLTKSAFAKPLFNRLAPELDPARVSLGMTRNNTYYGTTPDRPYMYIPDYTSWSAGVAPTIPAAADKYVLFLNAFFNETNNTIAFFTDAKTEKNFSYVPVSTSIKNASPAGSLNKPVTAAPYNNDPVAVSYGANIINLSTQANRFVMVAPTYDPHVALSPAYNWMYVGYTQAETTSKKLTLTISNNGNRRLYNPVIVIYGQDYKLVGSAMTLQAAVDAQLATITQTDADGTFIPTALDVTNNSGAGWSNSFTIDVELLLGKNPGTSYDGYVLFSADNLPSPPTPFQFNVDVRDKILPPPWLYMESPAEPNTVVSGTYKIRARFHDQTGSSTPPAYTAFGGSVTGYPYGVQNLLPSDIFVDYGTVVSVNFDPSSVTAPGFYSDWIIEIQPQAGLANYTSISMNVKQNSALDQIGAKTQTVSLPKVVTLSSLGPWVTFNVAEGAVLASLDTILISYYGNGISVGKEDSVYVESPAGTIKRFTDAGVQSNLQSNLVLTKTDGTPITLNITTAGQYQLTVADLNNQKVGSPAPVGFPNGDYELEIPANYIINYDGNYLPQTFLHFSIHQPEIPDGPGNNCAIQPATCLPAAGGSVRVWIEGKYLEAAKGLLKVKFLDAVPGYTVGQEVVVPVTNFTDSTAYLDVTLPPNMTMATQTYRFNVRLVGRQPSEWVCMTTITPPPYPDPSYDLVASVCFDGVSIDTTVTTLGYREGLNAYPHLQTYEGGPVDLKVVGKNLFHLNTAPNSNLRIRVLKDGVYTSTVIPVPTPSTLGPIVIPLGYAYTTDKNLTPNPIVYRYELWYDVGGVAMPVPETSTGLPFISDSTVVDTGFQVLEDEICKTEWAVSMKTANTKSLVKTWLVEQLNELPSIKSFGLTITEDDITFTDFEDAVAGYGGNPDGSYGYFEFTITLNTTPPKQITCGKGVIVPVGLPNVGIEREVIVPEIPGFETTPPTGDYHVDSGSGFEIILSPTTDATRSKVPTVKTNRIVDAEIENLDVFVNADGDYVVYIPEIREPVTISIGTAAANEKIIRARVWGESGKLTVSATDKGEAVVYTALGELVATIQLEAGATVSKALPAGIYFVKFFDVTYKIIVK